MFLKHLQINYIIKMNLKMFIRVYAYFVRCVLSVFIIKIENCLQNKLENNFLLYCSFFVMKLLLQMFIIMVY